MTIGLKIEDSWCRYIPLLHRIIADPALFEDERKKLFATQAMDNLNDRFGRMSVTFGSLLPGKEKSGSHVIPPSWRPDGIKNVDVE